MSVASLDPELELLRQLAGCTASREASRVRIAELLRAVAWDRFADELSQSRLLPLIGSRALAIDAARVPAAFHDLVTDARTRARARGLGLETILRETLGALGAARIRALPLKGTSLAVMAHDDVGLRESTDVDLLVDAGQLRPAVERLLASGYTLAPGLPSTASRLPDLHLTVLHPSRTPVELHWRVHWYESRFATDMLGRATVGPGGVLAADAVDMATSLLLFYARDGFFGLRMAADIAAWYDRNAAALPSRVLEDHARRYPGLATALTAAAQALEDQTGVPSRSWLGDVSGPRFRTELAVRLGNWSGRGDVDQAHAEISLIGGLLGPAHSTRAFIKRELLDKQDGLWPTAIHVAKTLTRYLIAIGRAVRSCHADRRG